MLKKFFNKDGFVFGLLLGIILPALFYLVLYVLDMLVKSIFNFHLLSQQEYLLLLSLAINLLSIRYYFVNLKYDRTGRGVLIVTFAIALVYFAIF